MYKIRKIKFLKKYNEIFLFNKTFFNTSSVNLVRSNLIKNLKTKMKRKSKFKFILRLSLFKNYRYFCRKNTLLYLNALHFDMIKLFFNKKRIYNSILGIATYFNLFSKFLIKFLVYKFMTFFNYQSTISFFKLNLILFIKLLNKIFPAFKSKFQLFYNLFFFKCFLLIKNTFMVDNFKHNLLVNNYLTVIKKETQILSIKKINYKFIPLKNINIYKI